FRVVQLPYNLAMLEAFTLANQPADTGLVPMLRAAEHVGVYTMASASMMQGQLARGLPPELGTVLPGLATDAQRALQFVRSTPGVRPGGDAGIFDGRRRLLLQQRSDGGQWGLPGGSVEIGESVSDAVAREVREETGLTIATRRLVGVYSEPRLQVVRYPDGNVWHYVNVCFECVVRGGTLTKIGRAHV